MTGLGQDRCEVQWVRRLVPEGLHRGDRYSHSASQMARATTRRPVPQTSEGTIGSRTRAPLRASRIHLLSASFGWTYRGLIRRVTTGAKPLRLKSVLSVLAS